MNNVKYSCSCGQKNRVLLSKLNDSVEATQLDKALDQLIDSAWDDEDEEVDELLGSVVRTIKRTFIPEEQIASMLQEKPTNQTHLVISSLHLQNQICCCKEASPKLSIILNWGFAELYSQKEPDEGRLLEVLDHIEPFTDAFKGDIVFDRFLQELWSYSINNDKRSLISKQISVSSNELNVLVDKILSLEPLELDIILDETNFNRLAGLIVVPDVFKHVSYYLAEKDSNDSEKIQILLKAIIKTARSNLPTKKFLSLYPPKLRPIAIMLNDVLNPCDPLILKLLEQVKSDCYLDFVILVTHFPIFLYLKCE